MANRSAGRGQDANPRTAERDRLEQALVRLLEQLPELYPQLVAWVGLRCKDAAAAAGSWCRSTSTPWTS